MAGLPKLCVGRLGCPGQKDHGPSPLARLALDVDQSAVCSDNATDRGEPQAGTLGSAFGGKKRLKELLARFRVLALAVVGDD